MYRTRKFKRPVNRRYFKRKAHRKARKGLIAKALFPVYKARPERKCFDIKPMWSAETIDDYTAYSQYALTIIPGGSAEGQRIGNKVFVKSLHITGQVRASVSNSSCSFRIAVVLDRSPNSVANPSWSDIWESSGTSLTNLNPLRNSSTLNRYVILYSRIFQVGYITQTGTNLASIGSAALPRKFINIYKKMNLPVTYTDTSGATPQTNCISIFAWSDTTVNTPQADMNCRVEYVDM